MKQQQLLAEIKLYLDAVGYQKGSKDQIYRGIKAFLNWLETPLEQVNLSLIRAYHQHLKERPNRIYQGGLSSQSINLNFWYVRVLFGYLLKQGLIDKNPITGYKLGRATYNKRNILTSLEIKELYKEAKQVKERLILHLFYGLGLRRSEGVALNMSDLNLKNNLIYIRKSKKGGSRKLPINKAIAADFRNYLADRKSNHIALVLNNRGGRMLGQSYLRQFKQLLSRTAITKKIDLHCLRHSIATHLIQGGMPLEQVRDYLGHRHIESTQNYLHYGHQDLSV